MDDTHKVEEVCLHVDRVAQLFAYLDRLQANDPGIINNQKRIEHVCDELDKELGLKSVSGEE